VYLRRKTFPPSLTLPALAAQLEKAWYSGGFAFSGEYAPIERKISQLNLPFLQSLDGELDQLQSLPGNASLSPSVQNSPGGTGAGGTLSASPRASSSQGHQSSPSGTVLFLFRETACLDFENQVLKHVKNPETVRTIRWHPIGNDDDEAFDFGNGNSQLLSRYFGKSVDTISLRWMNVRNFSLKDLPGLKKLSLIGLDAESFEDQTFDLQLPNLVSLTLDCTCPPERGFTESLRSCPRIQSFLAYKYWSPSDVSELGPLELPNCVKFTWQRGDGLKKLKLWLPRVFFASLDHNFDLEDVEFLHGGDWGDVREQSDFYLSVAECWRLKTRELVEKCQRIVDIRGMPFVGGSGGQDGRRTTQGSTGSHGGGNSEFMVA